MIRTIKKIGMNLKIRIIDTINRTNLFIKIDFMNEIDTIEILDMIKKVNKRKMTKMIESLIGIDLKLIENQIILEKITIKKIINCKNK